tara:strand:- start:2175 stop:3305 length:1131 start_codon:yes stop_codon:yes gene_type:complete
MKNRVYKYIFSEFIRYFMVVIFAVTAIIWTIQAVNFLDLVTEDGHAFFIYLYYSFLTLPKIITKLIPFTFLIASMLTILKLEKDNELIILWTSGLNKINIVNLIFRISLLVMLVQITMSSLITPTTLNYSRNLIKNSELQFVPSLLKEKRFNDTVEGLTIFVNSRSVDGIYEDIFIRDEGTTLTNVSGGEGSSTIFAKSGYVSSDEKSLVLQNGNIQRDVKDGTISIIKFKKTSIYLSGLSTKTTSEPKIQETSTLHLIKCLDGNDTEIQNCNRTNDFQKDVKIEMNKRFGMPMYIPLISLIVCFILSSRKDKRISAYNKYIFFILGFIILVASEITVRYSGLSLNNLLTYYLFPVSFVPITYFFLMRTFKYENLN